MLLQQFIPNINYSKLTFEWAQGIVIDDVLILSNIIISSDSNNISFSSNRYINELSEYYFPSMFDEYELPIIAFKEWLKNKQKVRLNCFLNAEIE